MLYNMLKKLIERKYYVEKQTIVDLLNNFVAFNQITLENYEELMLQAEDKYTVVVEGMQDNIQETKEENEVTE